MSVSQDNGFEREIIPWIWLKFQMQISQKFDVVRQNWSNFLKTQIKDQKDLNK